MLMQRLRLWDYSDAYILVKRTISISAQTGVSPNNDNEKEVIKKLCSIY